MAANNFFDHDDPNGTSPFDRINATGYVHREAGENIAAGNASAKMTTLQLLKYGVEIG